MSESEPKRDFNERNVCLPFPQPMARSDGFPIWPFSQKGFPLFYGSTNFVEKCVEISDETGVKALQTMGFFGFHSKFKFIANNDLKANILSKHRKEDSKQTDISSDSKNKTKTPFDSNGNYVLISTSIPNALSFSNNQTSDETQDSKDMSEIDSKDNTISEQMATDLSDEQKRSERVLKLSFLESFFISYVFGSLNLLNTETNDYMTIEQMWDTFGSHYSEDKLEFAVHYSAYHYFRSKGWVVRNGHSFGTHFLLYKEGPHLYHSLYSVLIQYSIDGQNNNSFDWFYMSALIRLSKNVRKELIVCVVNLPKIYDISSPKCIQDFKIGLLRFDRWNVTKTNPNDKG